MRPQTYFRLALLLPYILWGFCVLIVALFGAIDDQWMDRETTILHLFEWIASVYMIGILFWFIPYTLLAIALWIWSLHRQTQTILRVFAASPLILAVLIIVEISIFAFDPESFSAAANFENFGSLTALTGLITLVAGYTCVGIGFGLYKLLQRLGIIREPHLAALPEAATQTG